MESIFQYLLVDLKNIRKKVYNTDILVFIQILQVYGPCVLLVVISWVSFWLNRDATSQGIPYHWHVTTFKLRA